MDKKYLKKRVLLKKGKELFDVYIHDMFDNEYFRFEILENGTIVIDLFKIYEVVDTMMEYVHKEEKEKNIYEDLLKEPFPSPWTTQPYPWTTQPTSPLSPWQIPKSPYDVWYTTVTSSKKFNNAYDYR